MFDWSKISTVLLDMDGTILDLHFDSHFWLEYLPLKLSEKKKISLEQAKKQMLDHYHKVSGTIDWYCLDYWTRQTQLPIRELKRDVDHLIQLRADADSFLTSLKQSGRKVVLVTNAHPDSLSLKIERTKLDKYFDKLYSTHQFGVVKESQELWHQLQQTEPFNPENTLFVDDNISILESAQQFGIKHLLAIANPDSKKGNIHTSHFCAVTDYSVLIDDIIANPI